MPDDPRQAYEEGQKKRREEFRQQHPIRAGAGDAAMGLVDFLRGLFVGGGEGDSTAANVGELTGAGSSMLKAMVPLFMATKYRKFYHGSPNKFSEFRLPDPSPDFPAMPVDQATYLTPDPRYAAMIANRPDRPGYMYEVEVNPELKIADFYGGDDVDDLIRARFGEEGLREYNELNKRGLDITDPVLRERGYLAAPELQGQGIGGVRYESGAGVPPRGWSLAVSDPRDVTIKRVIDRMAVERLSKMKPRRGW